MLKDLSPLSPPLQLITQGSAEPRAEGQKGTASLMLYPKSGPVLRDTGKISARQKWREDPEQGVIGELGFFRREENLEGLLRKGNEGIVVTRAWHRGPEASSWAELYGYR